MGRNAIAIRPVPGQQARTPTHPEDGGLNCFSRSASRDSTDPFANERFCASIHHLATSGLASKTRTASIYKTKKFSYHAPLTIGYDFSLRSWRQRPVELNIRQSLRTFGSSPWTAVLLRRLPLAGDPPSALDGHQRAFVSGSFPAAGVKIERGPTRAQLQGR